MTQTALFDDDDLPESLPFMPASLATMHRLYGVTPGAKCKTCAHLAVKRMGGTYYKCILTRITAGPGTDWRTSWQACGKWQAEDQS